MGRLNSLIKFVVLNANALLFLGGIGTVIVASIILCADFITLAKVRYAGGCEAHGFEICWELCHSYICWCTYLLPVCIERYDAYNRTQSTQYVPISYIALLYSKQLFIGSKGG